jgi:hypothetical protein
MIFTLHGVLLVVDAPRSQLCGAKFLRMPPRRILLATLMCLFCASSLRGARQPSESPESVIRRLVQAIYANDAAAYNAVTIEHPLRSRLTAEGRVNAAGLRRLKEDPEGLQIRQKRPMLSEGKPVTPGRNGDVPVGTTALYVVAHGGAPTAMPLVRRAEGWKVDIRWWIAMTDLAGGRAGVPNGPEQAIRGLVIAMIRLDRQRAATFVTDPASLTTLFAGAPRQREPSGVLDAAAEEMPLVEIGLGEMYPMPSRRIVEGGSTDDRKAFVGLFGPVEMPFVVRRVGGVWKVEAEPYFILINQ